MSRALEVRCDGSCGCYMTLDNLALGDGVPFATDVAETLKKDGWTVDEQGRDLCEICSPSPHPFDLPPPSSTTSQP